MYYNISAPAKLNLNLYVQNKIANGLHYIQSDMCFLELTDKIYFKFNNKDVFFQNNKSSFLIDSDNNLILSALRKFRSFTGWKKKFEIYLDKQIPI